MAIGAAKVGATTGGGNASTITVQLPAGLAEGDEMRLSVSSQGNAFHTVSAGWALVAEVATGATTSTTRETVWRKRAAASETAVTVNYTDSGGLVVKCSSNAVIVAWDGVDATTPDDVAAATVLDAVASLAHVVPALTTVTAGARFITIPARGGAASTATPPAGHTELVEAAGFNRSHTVGEEDRPTAGDTGTRTWTPSASLAYCAISMALRPAGDATPSPISVALASLPLALTPQAVAPTPAPSPVAIGSLPLSLAPQALAPSPSPAAPSLASLALALVPQALAPAPAPPSAALASLALLLTPQALTASAGAVAPVVALQTLTLALSAQSVTPAAAPAVAELASLALVLSAQSVQPNASPATVALSSLALTFAAQSLVPTGSPVNTALASLVMTMAAQALTVPSALLPIPVAASVRLARPSASVSASSPSATSTVTAPSAGG